MGVVSVVVDTDGELYFDEDFQVPFDAHLMPAASTGEINFFILIFCASI